MREIKIGKRKIGEKYPTYFIADIAANHDGDLGRAKELIYLCAKAGADAAKFQNFHASKIVSDFGFRSLKNQLSHQKSWKKSVFEIYQDASLPDKWTRTLKDTCKKAGIEYFTAPYDFEAVDLVDPYVKMYKIGSGDVTWVEMIDFIAKKGKPVFIATGASTLDDVKRAMKTLLKRTKKIILMQCNTNYTASLENFKFINLNVLKTFKKLFPETILGLSDHTPGHATVLGAVTLGAKAVEKHFTDDNDRVGPDHKFALNPKDWKEMVERTRELEYALGDGVKKIERNEKDTAIVQRRSLRATRNLMRGEKVRRDDIFPLRPAPKNGFLPFQIDEVLGKTIKKPIRAGEHFTLSHLK